MFLLFALCILTVTACTHGGDDDDGPAFPADYAATYTEVRACRPSGDHDLNAIRVLASPTALAPYRTRMGDFPAGAVVLKEEHDFADPTCSGPVKQWTVMQRLAPGVDAGTLGWRWQKIDLDRRVVTQDEPRCIGCHTACGVPPDGFLGTCTVP